MRVLGVIPLKGGQFARTVSIKLIELSEHLNLETR